MCETHVNVGIQAESQENGRSTTGAGAKLTDLETIGRQGVEQSRGDRRAEVHRRRIGRKMAGERITHNRLADHLMLRARMQNGLRIVVSRERSMSYTGRRNCVRLELFDMGNGREKMMRRRRHHDMRSVMMCQTVMPQVMMHQMVSRLMRIRIGKMRQQRKEHCQQRRQNERSLQL